MAIISSIGTKGWITFSNSFPGGFELSQFADDADSISWEKLTIASSAATPMGQSLFWNKFNNYKLTIAVVPGDTDDTFLSEMLIANTAGYNKSCARDIVSVTFTVPGYLPQTFSIGYMMAGDVAFSASSDGRIKTKTYDFEFQNFYGVQ